MSTKNFNLENAPEELRDAITNLNKMGIDLSITRDHRTGMYAIDFMHNDLMEPIHFGAINTFDKKLSSDIINRGLDIDGKELSNVMNLILKHKKQLIDHYTHSFIGFHNGRYYHNDIYEMDPNDPEHRVKVIPAEFTGNIGAMDVYGNKINPLAPKGNLQANIDGLRELVIPHTGLVLGLAAGASGLVLQHLDNLDTNITVTFYGETSHGKSTCEHIILSLFGDVESLKEHFNATENYHIESMSHRGILPYVIDEIKLSFGGSAKKAANDARKFLFSAAAGSSRGTMKNLPQVFHCPCIFSAEESILGMINDDTTKGQIYRTLERQVDDDHPLTTSDAHAKAIEAHILEHHGLIIPYVEQYMLEHGFDTSTIRALCQASEKHLLDTYKQLTGDDRIALRMAIILTTAQILDEACCFGINRKALEELLVDSFTDSKGKSKMYQNSFTHLKRQCKANPSMIGTYANYDRRQHVGCVRCDSEHSYRMVCFEADRLRKILSGCTFADILKEENAEPTSTADHFDYLDDDGNCKEIGISNADYKAILQKLKENGHIHANAQNGYTKYIPLYSGTTSARKTSVICIELF